MWTGSCKGRGIRYGVMRVNVSLHGSMWKSMYVHRLALTEASFKPRSAGDIAFTRRC